MRPLNLLLTAIPILLSMQTICTRKSTPLFHEGVEKCEIEGHGKASTACWENYLKAEAQTSKDPEVRCQANLSLAELYEDWGRGAKVKEVYTSLIADKSLPECKKWAEISYRAFQDVGIGKVAPDFRGQDADGNWIDLKALHAPKIILFFWSSGCGACKRAYNDLKEIHARLGKNISIVGISGDSDAADFRRVIREQNLPWPNIFDGNDFFGPISKQYSVHQYPTVFVLDGKKVVVSHSYRSLQPEVRVE